MMMSPSLQYRWEPSEPLCHTHIRSASLYTQLSLLSQERSRLCLCFNSVKYLDISPPSRAGPARLSLISGLNISGGVIVTSNFSQLSHKLAGSTTLQVGLTHQSFLYEKSTFDPCGLWIKYWASVPQFTDYYQFIEKWIICHLLKHWARNFYEPWWENFLLRNTKMSTWVISSRSFRIKSFQDYFLHFTNMELLKPI